MWHSQETTHRPAPYRFERCGGLGVCQPNPDIPNSTQLNSTQRSAAQRCGAVGFLRVNPEEDVKDADRREPASNREPISFRTVGL
jgi:hypothetical protein